MAEPRSLAPWRFSLSHDDGFTLIEIMVTIAVLLVGVLGTVALIDGASATTADNRARQAGTALARELVEIARSIPYSELEPAEIAAALQTRPGLADSSAAEGYTVVRRGTTFTVAVEACSLDDAQDGLGSHDVAVTFCADSEGPAEPAVDRNTDDYRRVAITLSWETSARTEQSRQATLVTNPAGGLGPTVNALTGPESVVDDSITSVQYAVSTSSTPASFQWSVNGDPQGQIAPSGTQFTFDLSLTGLLDGTYLLHGQALDEEGRAGSAQVLTVSLNRHAGLAPAAFDGGRNGNGSHVDLEWHANGEGDVVGYRVYRTDAGGAHLERACPPAASGDAFVTATSCVDESAPASGPLHYVAYAIDADPDGGLREGDATQPLAIAEGNTQPETPAGLTACAGGTPGCDGPDGQPAPEGTTVLAWNAATDPDAGDSIAFYRIYRDGTGYGQRLDRLYPTEGPLVYVDPSPGGSAHDYRVSAVDESYGESALSGAVTQ